METYRLSSKLIEDDTEYLIQTDRDEGRCQVASTVFINGRPVERIEIPHPNEYRPDQLQLLVEKKHNEKKHEVEQLLEAYSRVRGESDPETMFRLATAFYFKGFLDEAHSLLVGVTSIKAGYHEAFHFLAMTETAMGNGAEAVQAASKAVAHCPEYADYRNGLGCAYMAAGSYRQAVEQFQEAVNRNLYYGEAYFNKGLALVANALDQSDTGLMADVISRSTDCFRKAAIISTEFDSADFRSAVRALQETDLKVALAQLTAVRETVRQRQYRTQVAFHMKHVLHPNWINEDTIDNRATELESQLVANPNYADLHTELARCYLEKARIVWEKALDRYRKALQVNASLAEARETLVEVETAYRAIGDVLDNLAKRK